MDDIDRAQDREQQERDYRISEARRAVPNTPDLGCKPDCGMSQELAAKLCQYYADCLREWERVQAAKKRNGR